MSDHTFEWCNFLVRQATYYDPPEFCDLEAEEGSDFCAGHREYDVEDC